MTIATMTSHESLAASFRLVARHAQQIHPARRSMQFWRGSAPVNPGLTPFVTMDIEGAHCSRDRSRTRWRSGTEHSAPSTECR